jgi:phage tail sheath protein FI
MPEQFLHGVEVVEVDDGIRPIRTVKSSVIGVIGTAPAADASAFPLNEPVLVFGPRQAAKLGADGTLPAAMDDIYDQGGALTVVVRIEEGADLAATLTNAVGDAAQMTGAHAFLAAEAKVKLTPRIICAPGLTSVRPGGAANPLAAELAGILPRLRAVAFVDGPSTTYADAIAYREDFGSDRIMVTDPHVLVWDAASGSPVARPASARFAGVQSRLDNERGFWWSVSNQPLAGVTGIARPVSFGLSDTNSEANQLNEHEVSTVIHRDGFRTWGNRSTTADPMWAFLSVRRTADMIYESVEEAFLWAMDRPISANLIEDIAESVNLYLGHLKTVGAILGGKAWLDPELNTKDQLMAGKLFIDFDIEPPAPMEHLIFRAHREAGYYEELVKDVAREIATSAA